MNVQNQRPNITMLITKSIVLSPILYSVLSSSHWIQFTSKRRIFTKPHEAIADLKRFIWRGGRWIQTVVGLFWRWLYLLLSKLIFAGGSLYKRCLHEKQWNPSQHCRRYSKWHFNAYNPWYYFKVPSFLSVNLNNFDHKKWKQISKKSG